MPLFGSRYCNGSIQLGHSKIQPKVVGSNPDLTFSNVPCLFSPQPFPWDVKITLDRAGIERGSSCSASGRSDHWVKALCAPDIFKSDISPEYTAKGFSLVIADNLGKQVLLK